MSLPYNEKLITLAKILRRNMTKQESKLWYDCLSGSKTRFQRQKVIGNYIVDFYCHKEKLVIEIDGSQHETIQGLQADAQRTELLEQHGLTVIRFSNADIDKNFSYVCSIIDSILQDRTKV